MDHRQTYQVLKNKVDAIVGTTGTTTSSSTFTSFHFVNSTFLPLVNKYKIIFALLPFVFFLIIFISAKPGFVMHEKHFSITKAILYSLILAVIIDIAAYVYLRDK